MFVVDRDTNVIRHVKRKAFRDLGFTERAHLQEWIADQPSCLGEELLIIQKEFDGWNDTNERLDLLALDRSGGLVVIENKLDDSGRDVVWQALKYAAYCSTLSKDSIVDVYRKYLGSAADEAEDRLTAFFQVGDLEEIELNEGANQRIILVAAKFRKEVTATCLWLLEHNIDIVCVRALTHQHGDTVFLTLDQIIPPPEAEEYMIRIGSKKVEENAARTTTNARHKRRQDFWRIFLDRVTPETADLFSTKGPTIDSWLSGKQTQSGLTHWAVVTLKNARYEFHLDSSDKALNKARFDRLLEHREEIDSAFSPIKVNWNRNDDYKSSSISVALAADGADRNNWPDMIDWMHKRIAVGVDVIWPLAMALKNEPGLMGD